MPALSRNFLLHPNILQCKTHTTRHSPLVRTKRLSTYSWYEGHRVEIAHSKWGCNGELKLVNFIGNCFVLFCFCFFVFFPQLICIRLIPFKLITSCFDFRVIYRHRCYCFFFWQISFDCGGLYFRHIERKYWCRGP